MLLPSPLIGWAASPGAPSEQPPHEAAMAVPHITRHPG
jgi:hypothetical protein